jgi:hypothetical protein
MYRSQIYVKKVVRSIGSTLKQEVLELASVGIDANCRRSVRGVNYRALVPWSKSHPNNV